MVKLPPSYCNYSTFQKTRITSWNLCWPQCSLASSHLALIWRFTGPLKKGVRLGPAVTWSTEHLLQKSSNMPGWAPNQLRVHARCRRCVEGAGFKYFIAIMMTWPRVVTLIKRNSPHADKATVFIHIGVNNSACDGHCGGFEGVVTGEIHFDIDRSIWRPNI